MEWRGFYYVTVSIIDVAAIYIVFNRKKVSSVLAAKNWPVVSSFSKLAVDNYKLTSNEIAFIFITSFSIAVNFSSVVECLIRDYTSYYPLVIYNNYPAIKFTLEVLMLFVLVSVAIDAKRGYYNGNPEKLSD